MNRRLSDSDPENLVNILLDVDRRLKAVEQSFVFANSASEMVGELGNLDVRATDSSGNLRMVMSAVDLYDELGVHAHLAGLDASGAIQFYLSADTGEILFGGGDGFLNEAGLFFTNQEGLIGFQDLTTGEFENISIYSDGTDELVLANAVGVGSGIRFDIDTSTHDVLQFHFRESDDFAEVQEFYMSAGTVNHSSRIVMSNGEVVIWAHKDGVETVFNDGSYDIDHRFEGAGDANLWKLDAGNDRVGIGTASPGYKLDVNGSVNVATGNSFKINGVDVSDIIPAHGLNGTIPASTTRSAPPYFYGLNTSRFNLILPRSGVLKNFSMQTNSAQHAGGSLVATVLVNNGASALTVTVPAGGATQLVTDSTHTVSAAAGTLISIDIVNNSAGGASAQINSLTMEFV